MALNLPMTLGLPMVYLVDDECVVRDALAWLLRSRRLLSEGFAHAQAFEAMLDAHLQVRPGCAPILDWPSAPSCVVLDVRMPGTSGLTVFERMAERQLIGRMPVIFLTGHGDVATAVAAVKRGAFDFVEKPFADNTLVDRIERALERSAETILAQRSQGQLTRKLKDLSEREREVMQCVVDGHANKIIADMLSISVRTVEVHRSRVFDKMNVKSAIELANLLRTFSGS
jgi:two-component system, LuxR family, response regulator DctR